MTVFQIEEQQRADARERKEKGVEWKQKLFHLEGDKWIYNNCLETRNAPTEGGGT